MTQSIAGRGEPLRSTFAHLLVLAVVSITFELSFVGTNLNLIDEGWPLYAAMQLHQGGTLYDDVFFVFPPGHLLVAYIAYAIDPPGVVVARLLYAAFDVAMVFALYFLGRRLMPARYALFGSLLLSVAAETAHHQQLLFGYRYLAVSALALILFARWLERPRAGWLLASGAVTGLMLAIRLDPAFAVACAVGIGLLASSRDPRIWFRAGSLYAAGLVIAVAPVLFWLTRSVSLDVVWLESVVRPVAMTQLQSLSPRALSWLPEAATRNSIHEWFLAIQFRFWNLFYAAYLIGIAVAWWRDFRAGRAFHDPLLAVVVTWGGIFFIRSFGRSDGPHLYSAIPPICLLVAHAGWLGVGVLQRRGGWPIGRRTRAATAAVVLATWIFLMGSDRIFLPGHIGRQPLVGLDERIGVRPDSGLDRVAEHVQTIRRLTRPDDTILDLSASSLFHVLSGRRGPGYADVVMPGTFLSEAEERAFVARLDAKPPALVIFPGWLFDNRKDRAVQNSSPILWQWVRERYVRAGPYERFVLMLPKGRAPDAAPAPDQG